MKHSVFCLGGVFILSAALYAESDDLLPMQEDFISPSLFLFPLLKEEISHMNFSKERLFKKRGAEKQGKSYTGMIKHGHVQHPDMDWDWGFRTGVGYDTILENWSVAATYTRFHTKVFASVRTSSGLVVPTWQSSSDESELGAGVWRLHLDLADMEVGRSFQPAEKVVLRPHLGVRGAWIYQKGKVESPNDTVVSEQQAKSSFFSNNCVGVGLRSGLDSLWGVGRGFSLFGDGALSVLAGYYNIDQKMRPIQQNLEMVEEGNRVSEGIATAEMSFGMQYQRSVFTKSMFVVRLGYEMNYVFNQTRWMDWFSNAKGDLADPGSGMSLQGVTLGLRLDY